MTSWAATERLTITNTHFDKPHDKLTTYTSPTNRPRQLDYILVSKQLWRQARDAYSSRLHDLGSDHHAVWIHLTLADRPKGKRPRTNPPAKHPSIPWPPHNSNDFRRDLDLQLHDLTCTTNLNDRCLQLNTAIANAAEQNATGTNERNQHSPQAAARSDEKLQRLLQQRRQLPNNSPQRKQISWAITKQLQLLKRADQEARIDKLIQEGQGLKHISGAKSDRHRTMITSMTTSSGDTVTKRQSIADVFADFYADLYRRRPPDGDNHAADHRPTNNEAVQAFTSSELDAHSNNSALDDAQTHRALKPKCSKTAAAHYAGTYCACTTTSYNQTRHHQRIGKSQQSLSFTKAVIQNSPATSAPSPSYHYYTSFSHDYFTTD